MAGVMSPAVRNRAGASAACEELMGAKPAAVAFSKKPSAESRIALRFDIASSPALYCSRTTR